MAAVSIMQLIGQTMATPIWSPFALGMHTHMLDTVHPLLRNTIHGFMNVTPIGRRSTMRHYVVSWALGHLVFNAASDAVGTSPSYKMCVQLRT